MEVELSCKTPADFAEMLHELRVQRRRRNAESRLRRAARRQLTAADRKKILGATGGRCHVCGGAITGSWQADHVLAHSGGGKHSADNYLPAHALCNNYRWDYLPEEFQWILKIGVWARLQMEHGTEFGRELAERFIKYEKRREGRRHGRISDRISQGQGRSRAAAWLSRRT